MLTVEKSYCIRSDDDRSSTAICLNKKNGFTTLLSLTLRE